MYQPDWLGAIFLDFIWLSQCYLDDRTDKGATSKPPKTSRKPAFKRRYELTPTYKATGVIGLFYFVNFHKKILN